LAPDVRNLLRLLGMQGVSYREFGAAAAFPRQRRRQKGPLSIALVSPMPAAGRTTLCANLAWAFTHRGLRAATIDLTPSRRLSELYGANGHDTGALWDALAACDVAVLDTASASDEVLAEADEVVVVMRPEAAALAALGATEALLTRNRPGWTRPRGRYLVNAYDARRAAHRAVASALRARLGSRVISVAIQHDAGVALAADSGRLAADAAPSSQVVADLMAVSRELVLPHKRRVRRTDARVG
jgi:cellulose biosynthesis protein BcsQ